MQRNGDYNLHIKHLGQQSLRAGSIKLGPSGKILVIYYLVEKAPDGPLPPTKHEPKVSHEMRTIVDTTDLKRAHWKLGSDTFEKQQ